MSSITVRSLMNRPVGIPLAPADAFAKIGVTPMIGQNDEPTDVLTTPVRSS